MPDCKFTRDMATMHVLLPQYESGAQKSRAVVPRGKTALHLTNKYWRRTY